MKQILAYTAGLFDGEGTITLGRDRAELSVRRPQVSVSNNSRELLDLLRHHFGGVIVRKKAKKKTHRDNFEWRVAYRRAITFLQQIRPYMREPEKVRRTDLVLSNYLRITPRNGKYTPQMMRDKEIFEKRFFSEAIYARQRPKHV